MISLQYLVWGHQLDRQHMILPAVTQKLNIAPFLVFQVMSLVSGFIQKITSVTILYITKFILGWKTEKNVDQRGTKAQ